MGREEIINLVYTVQIEVLEERVKALERLIEMQAARDWLNQELAITIQTLDALKLRRKQAIEIL